MWVKFHSCFRWLRGGWEYWWGLSIPPLWQSTFTLIGVHSREIFWKFFNYYFRGASKLFKINQCTRLTYPCVGYLIVQIYLFAPREVKLQLTWCEKWYQSKPLAPKDWATPLIHEASCKIDKWVPRNQPLKQLSYLGTPPNLYCKVYPLTLDERKLLSQTIQRCFGFVDSWVAVSIHQIKAFKGEKHSNS